ncbi:outer membrane beta-barrel protein [Maribellus sp. YY47]|uniref:outer membrane beta-barrel protein n=1 Tax=Maribellus sp. YY47 TaxID=2929486 RepID=UPI00200070A1|nr:outer membrane beta-barrel protein [Maribellus sp. YY47]MCK3684641.1 PorT family protein [Maribellus sp. YY47]
MSNKGNMDKLIRDKFENFSVEPPAHVWTNLQEQMAQQRRKVRMIYVGWISAAAVVIFAFIAGWLLNERSGSVSRDVLSRQAAVQSPQTEAEKASEEQMASQKEVGSGKANTGFETLPETHKKPTQALWVSEAQVVEAEKPSGLTEAVERISYSLLQSIRAYAKVDTETTLAERSAFSSDAETTKTVDEITEADRRLMAANAKDFSKKADSKSGWIVGANVSPGYASHSASHSDEYSRNLNYNSSDGSGNVGGGLSIQYKTSSRLRVESGVYYAKNGMKSGSGSSDRLYAASPSFDFATGRSELVTGDGVFSNVVELSQGEILMNTTAGVVNITSTPTNATLALANTAESKDYASVMTADGRFAQTFDFVEIPLYLRYNVYDKKIGIDVMGGFNAGLVVGNNAYIESGGSRQRIGSTEDISTFNISGTVGVGLSYAISRHVSLAVEPRFNYYLNSINTNPDVVYKPYRLGLYTGVYYQF